jgi:hypothetical protein
MSEAIEAKKKRTRSPSYPFVGFEEALKKVTILYDANKRHAVPLKSVAEHWHYAEKSSGLKLTLSALKKFDLLIESGPGYVKVSDVAFRIIEDKRPDSSERYKLMQECALMPELYKNLWTKYGADLPADTTLRHHLVVELGFNDGVVDGVIDDYKNTISFAKLQESVKSSPCQDAEDANMPEQIESSNVSTSALTRRAVFVLTEGDVIITFPKDLSQESVSDLEDYLGIFMKKAKREAGLN